MNAPRKTVIVSASLAIIATQAMVTAAKKTDGILSIKAKSGEKSELRARIDAVVAQRETRMELSSVMMFLASKFGDGETSIAQKYFPKEYLVAQASGDDFSSGGGVSTPPNVTYPGVGCHGACYSNCHSACHSACHGACHGSRGWR